MPFTITSIFHITSLDTRSTNIRRVFYADLQPEEDEWISVMMIAYADVLPANLDVDSYVFATGKAAFVDSELHFTVMTMSDPFDDFKTPVPASVVTTATVRSLPRLMENGYSSFEVSIDVFHERNTVNFPANITFKSDNPRFTKFSNSLLISSNLYIHGILYLQTGTKVSLWVDAKDISYIGKTSGTSPNQSRPWQVTPPRTQKLTRTRPPRPWEASQPMELSPPSAGPSTWDDTIPASPTTRKSTAPQALSLSTQDDDTSSSSLSMKLPKKPLNLPPKDITLPTPSTSSSSISPSDLNTPLSRGKRKSTISPVKQRVLPRRMSAKAAGKQKETETDVSSRKRYRVTDFALEENNEIEEREEEEDEEE